MALSTETEAKTSVERDLRKGRSWASMMVTRSLPIRGRRAGVCGPPRREVEEVVGNNGAGGVGVPSDWLKPGDFESVFWRESQRKAL